MRLHTNGEDVVILTPRTRLLWRRSGKVRSEELPPNEDISDEDRSGMLCLSPVSQRDFSARLVAMGAIAASAIDEESLAAVLLGEDQAFLVQGPLPQDGDWERTLPLGTLSPIRVEWPSGLIWAKADETLYAMADDYGRGIPAEFVPNIECNEHGVALASTGSGTVAVFRPGQDKAELCVQLPSQEEAQIFAVPTKTGVLVSVIVDFQDCAYLHIENDSITGYREAERGTPALLLKEGVLVYDDADKSLHLLDMGMKELSTLELKHEFIDAAASPGGASFVVAGPQVALQGQVNAKGEIEITGTLELADKTGGKGAAELAAAEAKWDPERAHGKSAVGFAAGIRQEPWSAQSGEPFELSVYARSTGGEGKGIEIEIAGDVLKHVEFSSIEIDGDEKPLVKGEKAYTSSFPDLPLPQGIVYPLNPKPKNDAQKHAAALLLEETHLKLKVRGSGSKRSSELMSVSIRALSSDSPPLKWMRPLTIE